MAALLAGGFVAARFGIRTVVPPLAPPERRFRWSDVVAPPLAFLFASAALASLTRPAETASASAATSNPASRASATQATEDRLPPAALMVVDAAARVVAVVVILVLAGSAYRGRWREWGLRLDRIRRDLLCGVLGYVACWPLVYGVAIGWTALLNRCVPGFRPHEHAALRTLLDPATPRWVAVLVCTTAGALAPLSEELYFRGVVQTAIAGITQSPRLGILAAAVAFGCVHAEPQNIPALVLLGVVIGYVYARTGSLLAAVALHAVFNLKTLLFLALSTPPP